MSCTCKTAGRRARQDDSLATIQRLIRQGYDKGVWLLHETHPKYDICDTYNGKIFDLARMVESLRYNAPIFETSHVNCFTNEVEIYTNQGWKLFKDLDKTEQVATLNQSTLEWEWQTPTDYIDIAYKGPIYHFKNIRISSPTTPNHRYFVWRQYEEGYLKDISIPTKFFKEAHELISDYYNDGRLQGGLKIPLGCTYNASPIPDFELEGLKWSEIDFASFMGWYLSEGSVVSQKTLDKHAGEVGWKNANEIKIGQSKEINPEKYSILENLLDKIGLKNNLHICKMKTSLSFAHNQFANYLRTFGKSYDKYVPAIIKTFSKAGINAFLDAYILGDGSTITTCTLPDQKTPSTSRMIFTVSPKMAYDLVELVMKAGYAVSVKNYGGAGNVSVDRWGNVYKSNYDNICITLKSITWCNTESIRNEIIDYDDRVYCVTVPNSTILVRHDGKVFWSGNCKCILQCYSSNNDREHIFVDWKGTSEEGRMLDKTNPQERRQDFLNLYQKYREAFDAVKLNPYVTGLFGDPDVGLYSFDIETGENIYDINNKNKVMDDLLEIILNQADKYNIRIERAEPSGNAFLVQTDHALSNYDFTQEELRTVNWRFKKRRQTLESVIQDLQKLEDWLVFTQDEINKKLIELETEYQGIANPWKETESLKKRANIYILQGWISPDGNNVYEIDTDSHSSYILSHPKLFEISSSEIKKLEKEFTEEGEENHNPELMDSVLIQKALIKGWIRLVNFNFIGFEIWNTNQLGILEKILINNLEEIKGEDIRIDITNSKQTSIFNYQDFIDSGMNLQKTINQNRRVAGKYDKKAWITDTGEVLEVPNIMEHADFLLEKFGKETLEKELNTKLETYGDVTVKCGYSRVIEPWIKKKDWIRVNELAFEMAFHAKNETANNRIENYVLNNIKIGQRIVIEYEESSKTIVIPYEKFIDSEMNLFKAKREFETGKMAFKKQAGGWWITPDNKTLSTEGNTHMGYALENRIINREKSTFLVSNSVLEYSNYLNLFPKGWIRVSQDFDKMGITCTKESLNRAENWLIEHIDILKQYDKTVIDIVEVYQVAGSDIYNAVTMEYQNFTYQDFVESGFNLQKIIQQGKQIKVAGKQVGTLYHFTNLPNLISILEEDILKKSEGAISFTRNLNFSTYTSKGIEGMDVRIALDGNKLSNTYKIGPYYYSHPDEEDMIENRYRLPEYNENEEQIQKRDVTNISNYILRIDIDKEEAFKYYMMWYTGSNDVKVEFQSELNKLGQLCKSKNIPLNLNVKLVNAQLNDKPTIALDFDGVIHGYSKGWKDGTIYDIPVEGVEEALKQLAKDYKIVVYTTRKDINEVKEYIQNRISPSNIEFEVTNKKPLAEIYIDDRAINFNGNWDKTLKEINNFKPYLEKKSFRVKSNSTIVNKYPADMYRTNPINIEDLEIINDEEEDKYRATHPPVLEEIKARWGLPETPIWISSSNEVFEVEKDEKYKEYVLNTYGKYTMLSHDGWIRFRYNISLNDALLEGWIRASISSTEIAFTIKDTSQFIRLSNIILDNQWFKERYIIDIGKTKYDWLVFTLDEFKESEFDINKIYQSKGVVDKKIPIKERTVLVS